MADTDLFDYAGLKFYDAKIKNFMFNRQMTKSAPAVQFYPAPETELEPIVDFMFTETPPVEGTKTPDNPSSITGVSSITVTRCETEGVDSADYTIALGDTYYGGSVNFKTGLMTVTHWGLQLDGTEEFLAVHQLGTTSQRIAINVNDLGYAPVGTSTTSSCTHAVWSSNNSAPLGNFSIREDGWLCFNDKDHIIGTQLSDYQTWFATQYNNGTPVTFTWKLATPFTVQLTPTQILSLPQPDPYAPQINTVYTDQQSVRVGWVREDFAPMSYVKSLEARIAAIEEN